MRKKLAILGVVAAVGLPIAVWLALVETYATATRPRFPDGKLYVANAFGNDVQVVDLATGNAAGHVPAGLLPHNLLVADNRLYTVLSGEQAIEAIDPAHDRPTQVHIVGDLPPHPRADLAHASRCGECHKGRAVGSFPSAVVAMPDGKLCVTELKTRQLSLVERSSLATLRTVGIKNPVPTAPSNVVFHPRTQEAFVLSRPYDDTATTPRPLASGLPAPDFQHDPPAGDSWLTVYDPDLRVLRWRLRLPYAGAYGAVFAPDGSELYVACRASDKLLVVDVAGHRVARTYSVGVGPTGLVPVDDRHLAVACFKALPPVVQLVDRQTGAIAHAVEVAGNPTQLTRDERTGKLYVACAGANQVVELDPGCTRVLRTFATGAAPVGVAVVH